MDIKIRAVPAAGVGFPDGSSRAFGQTYSGIRNPQEDMMSELPGLVEMNKRLLALEAAMLELKKVPEPAQKKVKKAREPRKWRWPWQRR